jgi:oligosaccharyltransferase complex subunit alpha (ribophorin I)
MGYNMPTEHHLFQDPSNPDEFTLEVDFMHSWDQSLSEDYRVRVVLPEGATNIRLELPFQAHNGATISLGKYFGTLDFYGRPEINIVKPNAVHEICNGMIRVKYNFNSSTGMLMEPV